MNMKFCNLEKGEYLLKVFVTAESDTELFLFGNHRHFLYHGLKMKKGDVIKGEFAVTIKDADFQKQPAYRDNSYELISEGDVKISASLERESFPVLFTLGDSTVCNQSHFGEGPVYRCGGWGQALPMFLEKRFSVSNHAEQGTHTADCLSVHLLPVLEQIKEGDLVLCQFGHNDQKNSFLDAFGGYFKNLVEIGQKVKEKGAEFIICTPINRLIYTDGKINNYLDLWRDGAKEAAKALGVKFIDLHSFTTNLYLSMGDVAENLFYHSPDLDRTHPNDFGAMKIAQFISSELEKGGYV